MENKNIDEILTPLVKTHMQMSQYLQYVSDRLLNVVVNIYVEDEESIKVLLEKMVNINDQMIEYTDTLAKDLSKVVNYQEKLKNFDIASNRDTIISELFKDEVSGIFKNIKNI